MTNKENTIWNVTQAMLLVSMWKQYVQAYFEATSVHNIKEKQ